MKGEIKGNGRNSAHDNFAQLQVQIKEPLSLTSTAVVVRGVGNAGSYNGSVPLVRSPRHLERHTGKQSHVRNQIGKGIVRAVLVDNAIAIQSRLVSLYLIERLMDEIPASIGLGVLRIHDIKHIDRTSTFQECTSSIVSMQCPSYDI